MTECALCGDYEGEHERPEVLGRPHGRCRARNYYGPGRNDFVLCGCPGFEAAELEIANQEAH
jgi:hypothetical protein